MKWSLAELRRRPRRRWPRRVAFAGLALVVAAVLFGFYGLPGILRTRATDELSRLLGLPVKIAAVQTHPLRLSATVSGVVITENDGAPLISVREATINLGLWTTLRGPLHIQAVDVHGVELHIRQRADGTLNLASLNGPATAAPPPEQASRALPPLRIDRASLHASDIRVLLEHGTEATTARLSGLSVEVLHFDTTHPETLSTLTLDATLESGGNVSLRAELAPTLTAAAGSLSLSDLNLTLANPLLLSVVPMTLQSGSASIKTRFRVQRDHAEIAASLQDIQVDVKDLQLTERGEATPFLILPRFASRSGSVDLATREVRAGQIVIEGIALAIERGPDGLQPLARLQSAWDRRSNPPSVAASGPVPTREPATVSATPSVTPHAPRSLSASARPFRITWESVEIDGPGVRFRDTMAARPIDLRTDRMQLRLGSMDLGAPDQPFPLAIDLTLNGGGSVRLTGDATATGREATVDIVLANLPLSLGGPYLEKFADVWLASGRLGAELHATWTAGAGTLKGNTTIEDLSLVDNQADVPLASWKRLALSDLSLEYPSLRSRIGEVQLHEPRIHAALRSDGRLNLSLLARGAAQSSDHTPPAPTSTPTKPSPSVRSDATRPAPRDERAPLDLSIGRVKLERGHVTFSDATCQPAVSVTLSPVSGTIERIETASPIAAKVSLEGTLPSEASLRIRGDLQAFGRASLVDLRLDLSQVDLIPFSPYSVRYTGYGIERGRLTLESRIRLARESLESSQKFTIERLSLGDRQPSAQATSLPVPLALALLTDARGRLILDLPVAGKLTDPSFHIGPTIARTLLGLLTKVATSPFALLGAAFGGAGEELATQGFAPGEAETLASEASKLATLRRALIERPGLRVSLTGQFDPVLDLAPLRERELARRVDAAVQRMLRVASLPEGTVIDEATRVAALAALFAETFPDVVATQAAAAATAGQAANVTSSTAPAAAPETAPGPDRTEPERRTLLARIVRLFTEGLRRPAPAALPVGPPSAAPPPAAAVAPAFVSITPEHMTTQLLAAIEVSPEVLAGLAQARAETVRRHLIENNGISPERFVITAVRSGGTRVELALQ